MNANMAPVVDLKRAADSAEGPLKFNMQTGRVNSFLFSLNVMTDRCTIR